MDWKSYNFYNMLLLLFGDGGADPLYVETLFDALLTPITATRLRNADVMSRRVRTRQFPTSTAQQFVYGLVLCT